MDTSLGRFFADMALDPARLAGFLEDPDALMSAANLPEEVRLVLRAHDASLIADRLSSERGGPASAPSYCPGMLALW
jgi:hypothetical protein